MLPPDVVEGLRIQAGRLFDPIADYLIGDIARRVAQAGQLTGTAQYQVWRAQNLGLSQRGVKKRVAQLLDKSLAETERLMTQSAETGYRFDLDRLPAASAIPFAENEGLQRIVQAAVKLAREDLTNITQTLGMTDPYGRALPLQKAYRACCDYAFAQVASGAADYNTAVRRATDSLARQGVLVIDYRSGVHTSVEAAVRRSVMGGLGLMQEQISQQLHDELGCDGWEISAHAASAPDHEPIQGRQYPDAQFRALNNSLVRRIGTLNCGHSASPVILGVSTPQYTPQELAAFRADNERGVTVNGRHYTTYEATQKQRAIERAIRAQKRRVLLDEAAGDGERLLTDRIRLRRLGEEYRRFSHDAGLRTQSERLRTAGKAAGGLSSGNREDGRGAAPKLLDRLDSVEHDEIVGRFDALRAAAEKLDYEMNCTVTKDGRVWYTKGGSVSVHPEQIETLYGQSLEGSYSYHNHPEKATYYSFSREDVGFFLEHQQQFSMASDVRYRYYMERLPGTLPALAEKVNTEFDGILKSKVLPMSANGEIDIDIDGFHEIVKELAGRYHFRYERTEKNGG